MTNIFDYVKKYFDSRYWNIATVIWLYYKGIISCSVLIRMRDSMQISKIIACALVGIASFVIVPFVSALTVSEIEVKPNIEKVYVNADETIYMDTGTVKAERYDPPYYQLGVHLYKVDYHGNRIKEMWATTIYDFSDVNNTNPYRVEGRFGAIYFLDGRFITKGMMEPNIMPVDYASTKIIANKAFQIYYGMTADEALAKNK